MDKSQAKLQIDKIIEKYERVKASSLYKKYNEANTRKDFIIPLFKALGWDVYNDFSRDVVEETDAIRGTVDYSFLVGNMPKFLLEAKALSVDLDRIKWARQSINYGWNKNIPWVVLSDFEGLKLFNSEWNVDTPHPNIDLSYKEYISRFDKLWLLSKESMLKGELDKNASEWGILSKRINVGEKLIEDFVKWRSILFDNLKDWNLNNSVHDIDESVQRILDRLIFIRVCEDRKLEPPILWPSLQKWLKNGRKPYNFMQELIPIFREFDKNYDSNLFDPHACENLDTEGKPFVDIINDLYVNVEEEIKYRFDVINADVLGGVYENYLGYKLSKSKKEDSMGKDSNKRKEQGIYYTPSFIVDYIVRNALKPVLDKCTSIHELRKIKVLDPACGSGSFLIKALEVINEKYKEFGNVGNELTKIQILQGNLYGVDLDEQAIEIARLNLLLNTLEQKGILPSLDKNIRIGNSLISGTDKELKKYFGKNFKDKKPFNWHEEFPEVFKQGGFDVIIGNPPYIKEFVNKSAFEGLHNNPYYQGKMDIWTMFACISIDLLKDNGTMSFIAPNNWISNTGASIFRDKILKDGELKSFIDFGNYKIFEQAGIQTMIYVFKKQKPQNKYNIEYLRIADKNIMKDKLIASILGEKEKIEIEPQKLIGKNIIFANSELGSIFDKLESKKNFSLEDKEIGQGIVCPQEYVTEKHLSFLKNTKIGDGIFVLKTSEIKKLNLDSNEAKIIKPFYTSEEISRYYSSNKNKLWIIYSDKEINKNINKYPKIKEYLQKYEGIITSDFGPFGLHRARDEKLFIGPSIFSIRKTIRPQFSYVNFPCYVSQTYFIISTNRIGLKFLTGLLNSKLTYFWLKNKGKLQGDMLQVDKGPLLEIPIYAGDKKQEKEIIILVDKIIDLNRNLKETSKNSDKYNEVKEEINKTDKKIDEKVYKLYDLTPEEIKIVENS